MTQDQSLATLQRPQVGLGFMKIKFTSDNNRRAKRNAPLSSSKTNKKGRLPSVFSEVIHSLKSNKDRQLDSDLRDLNIRKRNREVEHFLSQRQFFLDRVFTNKNELRFSRFKNKDAATSRVQSCPPLSSTSPESDLSLTPTVSSAVSSAASSGRSGRSGTSGTSVSPPSVTSSVTPALPSSSPDSSKPKSQATPRSSMNRSRTNKKETPALLLRDLLFLEVNDDALTPNRRRIIQARARMFPSNHGNNKRLITAPGSSKQEVELSTTGGSKQELELPNLCPGGKEGRQVRFQNKPQVHKETKETKSKEVVRTAVERADKAHYLPYAAHKCSHVEDTTHVCRADTARKCSHVEGTTHTCNPDADRTCSHTENIDTTRLEDLDAAISTGTQQGLMLTTPTPRSDRPGLFLTTPTPRPDRPPKVSWSESVVELGTSSSESEGRAAKQRFQAQRQARFSITGPTVDLEAHERMLQRIMVTIPPDVLTKACAHVHNLSDMLGYSEQKQQLLQLERRHGQRLHAADTRFVRLLELLKK